MSETIETKILRHCVSNKDGLSYLQERILNDPKPVRIFSAPTGAGKSYAFQKAVIENQKRILFIVPTRRLAQNLANSINSELIEQEPMADSNEKLAIWTSDAGQEIKRKNPHINLSSLRIRELRGLNKVNEGDMIISTPEIVASHLIFPRLVKGSPVNIFDFVYMFDHIVFDEFHTIEARGFGLAASITQIVSKMGSASNNKCKVTFLSATPIEISGVLKKIGVNEDSISIECEKVISGTKDETGKARAVHGDVTVKFNDQDKMCEILEKEQYTIKACLDSGRQVVIIFDSLKELMRSSNSIISILENQGLNSNDCLQINSVEDGMRNSDGERQNSNPLEYKVLLCTSSVEMGVNFNAGLILMDPGFSPLSFIQRVGRVARGDETGEVIVCCESARSGNTWLKRAKLKLKSHKVIEIEKFVEIFAKSNMEKFKIEESDYSLNFEIMANRAIYCSALFWHNIKKTWVSRKQGIRHSMKEFEPSQVKYITRLLYDLSKFNLKSVDNWIEAFEKESKKLRSIGPTVVIKDSEGVFRPLPYNIYVSNSYLISCESVFEVSGELVIHIDRPFKEILDNFGDTKSTKEQRNTIVPYSNSPVPVDSRKPRKDWIKGVKKFIEDKTNHENLVESSEIAVKLVGLTGIVPFEDTFEN